MKEIDKIPNICKHFQCVFEIDKTTSKSNYKRIEEWKRECPRICPKWRGERIYSGIPNNRKEE